MKVTYEWDSNKDDVHDKWLVDRSGDMFSILHDIMQQTREWLKHDSRTAIPSDEIREKIIELCYDHNISPDELV